MITLKIAGSLPLINVSNLCVTNYFCVPAEVEVGSDFKTNPCVTIKHNKPVDGNVLIFISPDNMHAYATFMPPINGGKAPAYENALKLVFSADFGIKSELVDEMAFKAGFDLAGTGVIVYQHLIASGTKPVNGTHGKVTLFFDQKGSRPDMHSAGKADYRMVNKYVNVRAEQLLARVTLPTLGSPGCTVTGKEIPQVEGHMVEIEKGQGVRVNETGADYYATIDGYVTFEANTLNITPTIEVKDIDFSVGNIDFVGDVNISGDVQPGFTVKGKNVTVGGVVQDASIIAEESLTIKVGAKGSRTDFALTAGTDIIIGYCEDYILNAKNNIIINKYSFNSVLNCGQELLAADTKSTVAGGKVVAFSGCKFHNLGTRANTAVEIVAGRRYDAEEKLAKINDEKVRLEQTLVKINEALSGLDLTSANTMANIKVKKMVDTRDLIVKRIDLFNRRIETISSDANFPNPRIEVHNEVQEGAVIKIHDVKYVLRSKLKRVVFTIDKATGVIDYKSF
jgi:uncharacterized protein (DUF342 family)